jgi:tetratricopeptide (TPR) repeat protein
MGHSTSSIESYKAAIKLAPNYAEAYSNLGNALQVAHDYQQAIKFYKRAIEIDSNNPEFIINLGNACLRVGLYWDAVAAYRSAIQRDPNNSKAHFYLSLAEFSLGNFHAGWAEYEWRWLSKEVDSKPLKTAKPTWQGQSFDGCLFIWSEQGIGDQILHASILRDLMHLPQKKIVSVEKKLLPIFKRSFPEYQFFDKNEYIPEFQYDCHLPIGSLGKFFRNSIESFKNHIPANYLVADKDLTKTLKLSEPLNGRKLCGLSWKSSNKNVGGKKSIALMELAEILTLKNITFLNLQYGDISSEVQGVEEALDISFNNIHEVDLYEDMDHVLSMIDMCDIILTTSNSTAHMAGALGKEVILLLPCSEGKIWYWFDVDGVSLWYPSVTIFKQETQGDWSGPIRAAKALLEAKFGS